MTSFPTVEIPAYEFQFNLVVYPLPEPAKSLGNSYFFILKDNAVHAHPTGGRHWLSFLPGHVYCFYPSELADHGIVEVFDHIPDFIRDLKFCMEIKVYKYNMPLIIFHLYFH